MSTKKSDCDENEVHVKLTEENVRLRKPVWTRKPEYGQAPCGWMLANNEKCPAVQKVRDE